MKNRIHNALRKIRAYAFGFFTAALLVSLCLNVLLISRPGLVEYVTDPSPFEVGYTKDQRARLAVLAETLGE